MYSITEEANTAIREAVRDYINGETTMSDVNSTIREYAPLAEFPDGIISMEKVTVPTQEQLRIILQYNTAASGNNWSTCETLMTNNPWLKNCKISSTKFNQIIDEVKAVELFYQGQMDEYFTNLSDFVNAAGQAAIGLNDTTVSSQTSYSSSKIENMLAALTTIVDFVLPVQATDNATGWVQSRNSDNQIVYTNTLTNVSANLTDDSRPVWYPTGELNSEEYEAFCYIGTMETKAANGGTLIFTCPSDSDYPTMDLAISIKGY